MAKSKSARKSSLGANPFETPKQTAPMRLLSLEPTARPPASGTAVARTARKTSQGAAAARRTKTEAAAKPAPQQEASVDAAPPVPEPPRIRSDFSNLEKQLGERLQQKQDTLLTDEQIARIEALLEKLEQTDLPEMERGLIRRLASAWQFFSMFGRSMSVDDFGLDPRFEEMVSPLFEFMYNNWWRVEASGIENVPAHGRALLVGNHSGMLPWDGAMIKYAIRQHHPAHREVRPLVEDFVYHFPFLGALMARIGGVRACQENAQRLLEKDELVAVFPEGVKGIAKLYRYRYQLQRFGRGGFVKLCLRTGAPLIPTAVIGAEEIHPIIARADFLARPLKIPVVPITPTLPLLGPLGLIPFPTKWYIIFGKPIDLRRYGKAALDDELLINRITHDVRAQIQEQIYEQLKKRRSVFFG
jgi:1-acyl-sn-glycerol-3-phosphate acyltransferase